jgi:hypothetical protein
VWAQRRHPLSRVFHPEESFSMNRLIVASSCALALACGALLLSAGLAGAAADQARLKQISVK